MSQRASFCSGCGTAIPSGPEMRFCPSCGHAIPSPPEIVTPAEAPPYQPPVSAQIPVIPDSRPQAEPKSKAGFWVLGCLGSIVVLVLVLMVGAGVYTWYVASSQKSSDSDVEALFRSMEGGWILAEGEGTEQFSPEQRRYQFTVRKSDTAVSQKHPYELKGESSLGSFTLEDVEEGEIVGGLLINDGYIQEDFGIYAIRATLSSDRQTLTMNLTYHVGDGTRKTRRFVFRRGAP